MLVDEVGVLGHVDVDSILGTHPVRREDDGLGLDLLGDFAADLLEDRVDGVLGVLDVGLCSVSRAVSA